ncbi:glycohydrolase toxin TNT-related protein [Actinomadura fibrosa]|uniref:Glycohydrolase toxin TNT-related protein n=1 Tax=Actinomadura fibrosa TaxID=111802 RepID=A0ABW2Y1C2_9ACTN|nr:glycohydrolase toxin TNT-related protein [Actinomadura fibrosa]
MLDQGQEDALLNDVATLVVHLLPGGWERASLTYRAVGESFESITLGGGLVSRRVSEHNPDTVARFGPAEELLPESGIYDLLRRLRSGMYQDGRGTWMQVRLDVECPVSGKPFWGVTFDWPDDAQQWEQYVSWEDRVPPRACAEELRLFPRPDASIPTWMREPLALQAAADGLDVRELLERPQDERVLAGRLPDGLDGLFPQARAILADMVPSAASRFLVGRLDEGCWSVIHHDSAWLAVHLEDENSVQAVPFREPRAAVSWAMGGVMADAGMEVNAGVLEWVGILARQTVPRANQDAWLLSADGRDLAFWRRAVPRPTGDTPTPSGSAAGRGAYVALDGLNNRPGGYIVCRPGPPPRRGAFISTHEVFDRLASRSRLPIPAPSAQASAQSPADEVPRAVTEVLPAGTELDAYGGPDRDFLFTVGAPFSIRGQFGTEDGLGYHVYRLQEPLEVSPGYFADTPIFGPGEAADETDRDGRGFYLHATIADLLRSGVLVEISEPGGEPLSTGGGPPAPDGEPPAPGDGAPAPGDGSPVPGNGTTGSAGQ